MRVLALAFVSLAAPLCTSAATLEISVKDARGAALADAVVWATPRVAPRERPRPEARVEQRNERFVPMVTVVQVGTKVRFPNRDPVRHHVYSFSAAKPFEIKLYAGTSAPPILFDKPGEVVLGCNIHDDMIGYIYVVDTPWFAKTGADGVVRLTQLPAGDYELRAWHYAQAAPVASQPAPLRADESHSAAFAVSLKAAPSRTGAK
jgi:plastocyanin